MAEYVARFIARTQQRYTQRGGMRPFGVSSILAGFSQDGTPQIYQVRARPPGARPIFCTVCVCTCDASVEI